MKIASWSKKVDEFVNQNQDLTQISEDGVTIHIFESWSGSLNIAIAVNETVTNERARDAIPLALEWMKRLTQFQGKMFVGEDEELLRYIELFILKHGEDELKNKPKYQDQPTGYLSYREVASIVNALVSDWLHEVEGKETALAVDLPGYTDFMFFIRDIESRFPDPFERSIKMLKIFRLKDKDIYHHLEEGIRSIRAGKAPFLKDSPLSRNKMISVMRWFRDEIRP